METKVFKPKFSPLLWALVFLYAAPWFYALINAAGGSSNADWKLFWILSSMVWLLTGLMQIRGVLLKKIVFDKVITVEMVFEEAVSQNYGHAVHIVGNLARFRGQTVQMQYLANAGELMQLFVTYAGMGKMDLVYEEDGGKGGVWTAEKNLICLIVFAFYMAAMLMLRARPLNLVGPATDAMMLGWAVMLPVLLTAKGVKLYRQRIEQEKEEKARWM